MNTLKAVEQTCYINCNACLNENWIQMNSKAITYDDAILFKANS